MRRSLRQALGRASRALGSQVKGSGQHPERESVRVPQAPQGFTHRRVGDMHTAWATRCWRVTTQQEVHLSPPLMLRDQGDGARGPQVQSDVHRG